MISKCVNKIPVTRPPCKNVVTLPGKYTVDQTGNLHNWSLPTVRENLTSIYRKHIEHPPVLQQVHTT